MDSTTKELIELYNRDLDRLADELKALPKELLWNVPDGIANSCGVLAQHLVGNLNHFIGKALGDTRYIRDREKEFRKTDISKDQLIGDVNKTKSMIHSVLANLSVEELFEPYPATFPHDYTVQQMLIHIYGHLNYHLGQFNYLRRMSEAS